MANFKTVLKSKMSLKSQTPLGGKKIYVDADGNELQITTLVDGGWQVTVRLKEKDKA